MIFTIEVFWRDITRAPGKLGIYVRYPGRLRSLDSRIPKKAVRFFNPVTREFVNAGHCQADSLLRVRNSQILDPVVKKKLTQGEEMLPEIAPEGAATVKSDIAHHCPF